MASTITCRIREMPNQWTQIAIALTMAFAVGCASEPSPASTATQSRPESNYGGLSLGPNDNSIVNIHMVNPSQEGAEALAEQHLDPLRWQGIREVRAIKVKYPKSRLDTWFQTISDDMGLWEEFPEVTGMGVSILENRVSVGVACGTMLEPVERSIRERLPSHGIPQDAVMFEVSGRLEILIKPAEPFTYECLPPEVPDRAAGSSSPGFGGMYFDSDSINVYLLRPSRRLAWELALAQYGRKIIAETGMVKAVRGQYTWEQLQEWWRLILNGTWEGLAAFPCEVDPRLNRITFEVTGSANKSVAEEELEEWLSNLGVPKEAVILLD